MTADVLTPQERIMLRLRALYRAYGYAPYQAGPFEDYDLYLKNKRFLSDERVLTFGDYDGKLQALKPDVTLSIAKHAPNDGRTVKVYYTETVYRVPRHAAGFREITQTGLECIGALDDYALCEALMLASRSLSAISERSVLSVSNLGVLSGVLAEEPIGDEACAALVEAIGAKNTHGLEAACVAYSLGEETTRRLLRLGETYGPLEETLARAEAIGLPPSCGEPLAELKRIARALKRYGIQNVNLDFSVVNDMDYYNGLIFRGFVDGAPSGVLSGGRYDNLLARMGRGGEAVGFAVYLDQLERLIAEPGGCDADALVLYDETTDADALVSAVEALVAKGKRVRAAREGDAAVTCAEVIRLTGEGRA